ncbi:MAG: FG-GAP-like repeat-containing protein [Clostridia bacterium]|nr:FG-GAP-like repeat-containing protein [Clostridia bacterium]
MLDLDNWVWRNPIPLGEYLYSMAYDGNSAIAVGEKGNIIQSNDGGINWTPMDSITDYQLYSIIHGYLNEQSVFVTVGDNGSILTHSEGIWNLRTSNFSRLLNDIAYGRMNNKDVFAAIAPYDDVSFSLQAILVSFDLVNWEKINLESMNKISCITFGEVNEKKQFAALGLNTIATSEDGLNWNVKNINLPFYPQDVIFAKVNNKDIFVAVGFDDSFQGQIFISHDLDGWTNVFSLPSSLFVTVSFSNGIFLVGGYKFILYSTDGVSWSVKVSGTQELFYAVNYLPTFNRYISAGEFIKVSEDLITWETITQGINGELLGVKYGYVNGRGLFVTIGINGMILTSQEGTIWNQVNSGTTKSLTSIAYTHKNGTDLFIAVGQDGTILKSHDAALWVPAFDSGVSGDLNAVAFGKIGGQDLFVAVGIGNNYILISNDGEHWGKQHTGVYHCSAVCYGILNGTGTFAAAAGTEILTSTDGVNWNSFHTSDLFTSVTIGNGICVAVGDVVIVSEDGIHWEYYPEYNFRSIHFSVIYGTGMFLAAIYGHFYTSLDGRNWLKRNFNYSGVVSGIEFGNHSVITVGGSAILQALSKNFNFNPIDLQQALFPEDQYTVFTGNMNGDLRTDFIIWKRKTGTWYFAAPDFENSSATIYTALDNWSKADTWKPFIGDFNGDGKSDIAAWSPQSGDWHVALGDGKLFIPTARPGIYRWLYPWAKGNIWRPLIGDFNGDGLDDLCVWNPLTGGWQVALSDGTQFIPDKGRGDGHWLFYWAKGEVWIPMVGDFNGDGKADIAVWHPKAGDWQVALSDGTGFAPAKGMGDYHWLQNWGKGPSQYAFIGDVNHDGLDDIILWDKLTGDWQVALCNGKQFVPDIGRGDYHWLIPWAKSEAWKPLLGDFNGDLKDDICVWNKVNGSWQVALTKGI